MAWYCVFFQKIVNIEFIQHFRNLPVIEKDIKINSVPSHVGQKINMVLGVITLSGDAIGQFTDLWDKIGLGNNIDIVMPIFISLVGLYFFYKIITDYKTTITSSNPNEKIYQYTFLEWQRGLAKYFIIITFLLFGVNVSTAITKFRIMNMLDEVISKKDDYGNVIYISALCGNTRKVGVDLDIINNEGSSIFFLGGDSVTDIKTGEGGKYRFCIDDEVKRGYTIIFSFEGKEIRKAFSNAKEVEKDSKTYYEFNICQ